MRHQTVRSEKPIDVETLDRMHYQYQQATRTPLTSAGVDNGIGYLRRHPQQPSPKPL
jgi:hypothetical protein